MKRITSIVLFLACIALSVQAEVVYTGEHSVGSWNALQLPVSSYSVLANASAGDVLSITMTADAADARIMLQNTSWEGVGDEYNIYNAASGTHAFALSETLATEVATNGIFLTGEKYTISKVELLYQHTLWTGTLSDNEGWAQSDVLTDGLFDDLSEGSLLGVSVAAIGDGADWHQYAIRSNWENIFANTVSAAGTVVHTLTAAEVESLHAGTVDIAAQYLDIDALYSYVATKSSGTSQKIWEGSVVMPSDWTGYQIFSASSFAAAEVDQLIRVKFTALGSNAQLQLKQTSDWTELIDAPLALISGRYYDYTITEDMLADIQANGMIISGCNYTLTEVWLLNPADLRPLTLTVPVVNNWVFEGKPSISIKIENPYNEAIDADVEVEIATDKAAAVETLSESLTVAAGATETVILTPENDYEAGFYKATCVVNDELARAFGFAVDPTAIVSAADKQADFDTFWESALSQLNAVEINATLTEIPSQSTSARKVYLVEMYSIADGTSGEPVVIRGYYAEPQDGQKHPVIMHYQGYDSGYRPGGEDVTPYCPNGDSEPDYAEFVLSTRGQSVNNRLGSERVDGGEDYTNPYGDWFAFNFGDKDSYYYRGAYMDCVRAIQFMASRSTSDMDNLYAEGQSQGGAFTYAAAALSGYAFRAIAPAIAFMGDFPDYFDIVNWPAYVARENQGEMSDAEMFAFLSYFDTKNLATLISCPVIACIGLQDNVCPPHTNIAPYNNLLSTDTELLFNPELYHQSASDWYSRYMQFFADRKQDTPSAIETAEHSSQLETGSLVFNILGAQIGSAEELNDMPAGLYIVNGEKVLVK